MITLEIWLAASLLLGAFWALAGLLLGEPNESASEALEVEAA